MKYGIQKQLARIVKISEGHLSSILAGKKRPSWPTAKRLAQETDTLPDLWMEGSPDEMKAAISAWAQKREKKAA